MRSKCWFDGEMGGLNYQEHSFLQGAFLPEVNGKIIDEWTFNIREYPLVVTEEALAVNKINLNEPGLTHAEFRVEYWKKINDWFYGGTNSYGRPNITPNKDNMPFFAGYNTQFDRPWLKKILGSQWDGLYFHVCDPMILATTLWDMGILERGIDFKLGTLCKVLGVKVEDKLHDAMVDIRATRECYERMKDIIYGRVHQSEGIMEEGLDANL